MANIKVNTRDFEKLLGQLDKLPGKVMREAEPEMVDNTPIRSGNARRNTRRRGDTKIVANYGYAGRLDDGWSRQAPSGFTDPTIDFIEDEVSRQVGRVD
jgi:hypothetical protein